MSLSRQVLLLNRQLMAFYKKELELAGATISLVDMLFLSYLFVHEGCHQDDFVKEFVWDKGHVARQLQSLEQRQLVHRTVDPTDKRAKVIASTPLGKSYEPLIRGIQRRWSAEVFDGDKATAKQLEDQLCHLLKRARALVSGEADSSTPTPSPHQKNQVRKEGNTCLDKH